MQVLLLFIIADKARASGNVNTGVGVVRDYELKLEEVKASHTRWSG